MDRLTKEMMRDSNSYSKYISTGKIQKQRTCPTTKLREFIDKIPMSLKYRFIGIKLRPKIVFNSSLCFEKLMQLHR